MIYQLVVHTLCTAKGVTYIYIRDNAELAAAVRLRLCVLALQLHPSYYTGVHSSRGIAMNA